MAVAILRQADLAALPAPRREAIERHLAFARNLHIETRVIHGDAPARTLVDFARLHGITHVFLARSGDGRGARLGRSLAQEVVRLAGDMQVTVVAERRA